MAASSLHIRPDLPLLPPHASGGYTDRMLYPVFVLQRGDKLFISNVTRSRGSVAKSAPCSQPEPMKSKSTHVGSCSSAQTSLQRLWFTSFCTFLAYSRLWVESNFIG